MKKNIMLVMAIIIVATFFLTKVNREEKMSDLTLANIEALAQNEGNETKVYCCGSTGTCAKLIGGGEIVGIAFYTPCPK